MYIVILTIIFFLMYAVLILYYRNGWQQIVTDKLDETGSGIEFNTIISVIIAARNEEKNIAACLQSVISQSYPSQLYEVIVIDDFSADDTTEIIRSFFKQNVSLISLQNIILDKINSYKKKAIETGIAKATGELIVITDADCVVPVTWLTTIAAFYQKHHPAFIAAPVAYYRENNFLKIFQSLDFMMLQGITGASVYKKFHSMCNGANLAYPKKIFYEVDGFKGIDNIASGDDMLLMRKIFLKYPDKVMFLKEKKAIVKTKAMETLSDFFNQRIRWASKADKYSDIKITMVLLFVYVFNLFILALGISSMFNHDYFYLFISPLAAKTIIELLFLYPVAQFFNKEKLLWWFAAAQPFHVVYTIIAGFLGKFGSYKWKERKVK